MKKCPICHDPSVEILSEGSITGGGAYIHYACSLCGSFFLTREAEEDYCRVKPLDYRVSAWIREHKEYKREAPKITSDLLENIIKNLPDYKVLDKQLLLLRAIERRIDYPGATVELSGKDYPLAYAKNNNELTFLLTSLLERNMVFQNNRYAVTAVTPDNVSDGNIGITISSNGWEYLDSQSTKPAFEDRVFVAMSFDKALNDVYEDGIKKAIEDAGYQSHRVDKEHHVDRIDAKIINDIKDSLFIVADVTGQKQGVYFEAGFAIGLNRPVIWCVRKDELEQVHFDTRQYNHIVWETPEDLRTQLYDRICAVIGRRKAGDAAKN